MAEAHARESEDRTAFTAVVAFTFILLLSPQNWIPALAPLRIAFLSAGAAGFFLLWDRWKRRKALLTLRRELILALSLLTWALITLPLSYWAGGSLALLSDMYLKAIIVFVLLANVVTTERRLRLIATSLMLCTIPLAFSAMKNFLTGTYMEASGASAGRIAGYQASLAANPNDLALTLNLIIPLAIASALGTSRPGMRLFSLFVMAFSVLGVILTFSRGGFLGLATIGMIYFLKLVRRPDDRKWAFVALTLALLSLPLLPTRYVHRIATITDIESDPTGSAQERWRDSRAAIHFIMDHPIIGAGIGMDLLALNEVRGTRWTQVHNVYLQYGVDLGLPGLSLFLLLFYGVSKAIRAARRRSFENEARSTLFFLTEAVEVSLIVFAVAGLFHPVAYNFYFYYFGGLALAARTATAPAINIIRIHDARSERADPYRGRNRSQFPAHELT